MLRLNDDCLLEIFKKFEFIELIKLTRVCRRFEYVVIEIIRSQFRRSGAILSSEDFRLKDCKLMDYKQFFKVMSQYIQKLIIEDTNCSAFSSYLERYAYRPSLEFFISLRYDSLLTLDCQDFKLNDSHMRQLANSCKLLRKLTLRSQYITGQHIENFQFLEALNFYGCNVQKGPLQRIVSKLPILQFKMIDNKTDVTKALVDSKIKSIDTIEITDPNFGLYFAAHPSLRYLVIYDHSLHEKEEPIEEAEPVEEEPVEGQAAERQPIEENPVERQPVEGQPVEGQAIERHLVEGHLVVGAPEKEQSEPVERLQLYPHTVWFMKRVKYIEAPRGYNIFESLARILSQLELPSTNPPNLNPVIEVFKLCRNLEVLKLELNDYDCNNLEQLTQLCVRGGRKLRLIFYYRTGRKGTAVKNIKMWRANSSLYKSQSNIVVEFIQHSYPSAKHLFSFKFT